MGRREMSAIYLIWMLAKDIFPLMTWIIKSSWSRKESSSSQNFASRTLDENSISNEIMCRGQDDGTWKTAEKNCRLADFIIEKWDSLTSCYNHRSLVRRARLRRWMRAGGMSRLQLQVKVSEQLITYNIIIRLRYLHFRHY